MGQRFITIWFRHLKTDWHINRRRELASIPFVLAIQDYGRMVISATNIEAEKRGISAGMAVADARAMVPSLEVQDDSPDLAVRLLRKWAEWCIRYTPFVCIDGEDGLILDITGCAHLWDGERPYLKEIITRIRAMGYDARGAIASTIGTAWAVSRYGTITPIIEPGNELTAIAPLPPASLRLNSIIIEKLHKLGLSEVGSFMTIQRPALRRRFGTELLLRLDQASGMQQEIVIPVFLPEQYFERLPCLEPIRTRTGIEIAVQRLLEALCQRLQAEGKGLRKAILKGYRIDGEIIQACIGTNRPSHHIKHLFHLFEPEIGKLCPELGIELFILEAPIVEDAISRQEAFWNAATGSPGDVKVAELLDRITSRLGADAIHRYLPDQHHWPERSVCTASSLEEQGTITWPEDRLRPILLLSSPELIQVTAPIPDYPPMLFIYRGKVHRISKADGPERIEREWWQEQGDHRDYYRVEDEQGKRYWVFRSGHYSDDQQPDWFIHGFFA
ncbi:DNA polymerase Y family protein [Chitinophaga sp. ysch24]|uniref:DNA polymerase Y family protein n=2 Tax=Chitinophaga tropicalis TaxID=2683588 RepID=A0A7K1U0E8_9BACT|nr:DNA polymerase Y family protein [Chitinophaga tropicalis]